jgi:hypothetical protein
MVHLARHRVALGSTTLARRLTREASTFTVPQQLQGKGTKLTTFAVFVAGVATGGFALDRLYGRSSSPDSSNRAPKALPEPTGAAAVWRGTFDPGSNPRLTTQASSPGKAFYDTVGSREADAGLTIWQQTLRAEDMRRTNFAELDKNNDGYLEREDLRSAFGVSANVDALIDAADSDGDGRIGYAEWLALKSKLAAAYERDMKTKARGKVPPQK